MTIKRTWINTWMMHSIRYSWAIASLQLITCSSAAGRIRLMECIHRSRNSRERERQTDRERERQTDRERERESKE